MRKSLKNHPKYLQKSIPEGSGGLLRASWAPGASQNCFQSPPGPQKNSMIAPGGRPERLLNHFSSEKKPGYHGTGSARGERACKHCKQGESSKSSKSSESRSATTTKKSKARVARAPRRSRQQARRIAYALARPLRGLAGRLELGALRAGPWKIEKEIVENACGKSWRLYETWPRKKHRT